MKSEKAWFAALQAGDEFAVQTGRGYSRNYVVLTISKATATQYVAQHGSLEYRFDRKSGMVRHVCAKLEVLK